MAGGKVLDYEEKRILVLGRDGGKLLILSELVQDNLISMEEAARRVGLSVDEFKRKAEKAQDNYALNYKVNDTFYYNEENNWKKDWIEGWKEGWRESRKEEIEILASLIEKDLVNVRDLIESVRGRLSRA